MTLFKMLDLQIIIIIMIDKQGKKSTKKEPDCLKVHRGRQSLYKKRGSKIYHPKDKA